MGIVEGSCGNRARGVSIRGKFVLSRNMGYRTRGVAMLLNVVLTPRQAYPDFKVQVRIQVLVLGIVVPFAPRDAYLSQQIDVVMTWLN